MSQIQSSKKKHFNAFASFFVSEIATNVGDADPKMGAYYNFKNCTQFHRLSVLVGTMDLAIVKTVIDDRLLRVCDVSSQLLKYF